MTSEQISLLPARSDDDTASLRRFEFAPSSVLQRAECVGTEVRQRVPLEPAPEKFDRIELRCIAGQEMELNPARSRSDVVADQVAAMRAGAVPDNEQRASEVSAQRFEELDNLLFGDGPFMQAKVQAGEVHAGDQRQLMPVEVELHRWGLAPHPQVRTRVGRSETPDSSMKTISLPWRAAFFLALAKSACASAGWQLRRVPGRVDRASGWTSPVARASARRGPRCTVRRTRARLTVVPA